jgi:DNA polymerase V
MSIKNFIINPAFLPISGSNVCAGFPSPADDYLEEPIDLSELLVTRKAATFLWRVQGQSMIDAGIYDGDILIVDRSVEPRPGQVVVAIINGEHSIKQLLPGMHLAFANKSMPEFRLPDNAEVEIWGIVTWNLHRHLP